MRRFVVSVVLASALGLGGWALYHKDQIRSPGDFFRLAADQIDRARSALSPSHTASWQSGRQQLIRIASFNSRGLNQARLSDPQIAAVLSKILSQFDVVALQEVSDEDPWLLQRFLNRLGNPQQQYDYVIGLPARDSGGSSCCAIIYNRNTVELEQDKHYTVGDPDDLMLRKPLVAWFRARQAPQDQAFTFNLVNLQFDPASPRNEILQVGPVFRAVRSDGRGEDDVILVGDFGVPAVQLQQPDIGRGLTPLVRYEATTTAGDSQSDNILIDSLATSEFSGESGVFDFLKLCNLTLSEAEMVSDHMPVWAEFSVTETTRPGRVARHSDHPAGPR